MTNVNPYERNLAIARELLQYVPATIHHDERTLFGMGLRSAGVVFDEWDTWLQQNPRYDKAESKSMWISFKAGKTGLGTSINIAKKYGYKITHEQKGKYSKPVQPQAKPQQKPVEPPQQAPGTNALPVWGRCLPALITHEYAVRKRLSSATIALLRVVPPGDNLFFSGTRLEGYLVVPGYVPDGQIQTIQFIPPGKGEKKLNLPGASMKGATLRLGNSIDTPLCFTESIANADSIHVSTGYQSVCCFGSGNIKTAVADYRSREPGRDFIIVPDRGKEDEAWQIAAEYQCRVAVLPEDRDDKSDINDLYCDTDFDVVATLIEGATKPPEPDYPLSIAFADELSTDYEPPDELIEGVITAGAGSVLYGDSNSGKTFLAIDMACAVARGVEWQGRKVEKGAVVYIAAESPGSVRGRLQAYQQHHDFKVPDFAIVQSSVNLYRDDSDTNRIIVLVKQIERQRGVKVRLIVGDTLARLSTGANENAGNDMGTVIERFDRIRIECNAHFMLIHHSGKNAANGARGWSGIRAAIDTELEVTDNPTGRCCEVMKQRDLQSKGERIGFRLDSVTLGVTKWGKPATSCVVVAGDAPEKKSGKRMGEVEGAVVEFLAAHKVGIKKSDVVKHFEGRYARQSIYRAITALVTAQAIHEAAGMVCIAVASK